LACSICGERTTGVQAEVDPRRATLTFTAQCGHLIPREEAKDAWRAGARWHTPKITGATLIDAERRRQPAEEGYTSEHDQSHDTGELAWAAWCYLDQAATGMHGDDGPPRMWPWEPEAWKPEKSPMRLLIVAGALIAAEIDRRLAAGEKP
jgi:hypothetical protein